MAEIRAAIALIESNKGYVFQRRPEGKAEAGKLGFFGGSIEDGEKPTEAVARELQEETGLSIPPHRFAYLGEVCVTSANRDIRALVYTLHIGKLSVVAAEDEGEVVVIPTDQIDSVMGQLTPATRATFEEFFE